MTLHSPFLISPRLLPALRIGDAWLSADGLTFWLDTPDRSHRIAGLRDPQRGRASVASRFDSMLAFLSAAAESHAHRIGRRETEVDPDSNEALFSPAIVEWAYQNASELECAQLDITDESGCVREELIS